VHIGYGGSKRGYPGHKFEARKCSIALQSVRLDKISKLPTGEFLAGVFGGLRFRIEEVFGPQVLCNLANLSPDSRD